MNPHANFNFHMATLPPPPTIQAQMPPQGHPAPANSPGSQSVPGRRTPLGSVGIGGFYAQSGLLSPSAHHTDENQPSGSRERYVSSMFF